MHRKPVAECGFLRIFRKTLYAFLTIPAYISEVFDAVLNMCITLQSADSEECIPSFGVYRSAIMHAGTFAPSQANRVLKTETTILGLI